MMVLVWSVVLGIVQGLTEFLPISSSAHLLIIPWLFGRPESGLAFDAALHIGTSIALVAYFWNDFKQLIMKRDRLLVYILIASIPAALAGFFGDKLIEQLFHNGSAAILIAAVGMLIVTAVIWYIDVRASQKRDLKQMTKVPALIVGFAQVLALIPGSSRSGVTIAAALAQGYTREAATRFSFLLGTPIALAAGLLKGKDIIASNPSGLELASVLLGVITSGIVGYIVIRWLLQYVQRHSLSLFLKYRAAFAILIIIIWVIRR